MFTIEGITGGKDYILKAAMADKRWQALPSKPVKMAMDVIANVAKDIGVHQVKQAIASVLQREYDKFTVAAGDRPETEGPPQDDWDSALDDRVQEAFEPFATLLSNSFFGEATVDTQLHRAGEIDKLAGRFALEAWQTLTWEKSTAKILSACGIVQADVEDLPGVIAGMMDTTPDDEDDNATEIGATEPMSNKILNKIIFYTMGATDDDAWDMTLDTDDNLSAGGAARLGLTPDEGRSMRASYRQDNSRLADWKAKVAAGQLLPEIDEVVNGQPPEIPMGLVREAPPAVPSIPAAPPVAPAPTPAAPVAPPLAPTVAAPPLAAPPAAPAAPSLDTTIPPPAPAPAASPVGPAGPEIPGAILQSMKDNGGFKDQEMADMCNVSRPTVGNFMKGKAPFSPTPDQRMKLILAAKQRRDAMDEVLAALQKV
jgi:hypothetical protein